MQFDQTACYNSIRCIFVTELGLHGIFFPAEDGKRRWAGGETQVGQQGSVSADMYWLCSGNWKCVAIPLPMPNLRRR